MGFFSKLFFSVNKKAEQEPGQLRANRNQITCLHYSVRGKNPETGRMKTVYFVVESTATKEIVQKKSGLLPPYEVVADDSHFGPTDRQIAYADQLGFAFPSDASSSDATVFLTRAEEERPLVQPATPNDILHYVIGFGIDVPAYAGVVETTGYFLRNAPRLEITAFFCMRVYCSIARKNCRLLMDASPEMQDVFRRFAEKYSEDAGFLASLSHYSADDLPLDSCSPLKKLKAYNIAADFLKSEGVA